MMVTKHFTKYEMMSPDNEMVKFHVGFLDRLEELRQAYGKPMIVNSSCRSVNYNTKIGGAKRSYHLYEGVEDGRNGALAIDIKITNAEDRILLIEEAINQGWSFGVYSSFIHLDRRGDLGHARLAFWGKY